MQVVVQAREVARQPREPAEVRKPRPEQRHARVAAAEREQQRELERRGRRDVDPEPRRAVARRDQPAVVHDGLRLDERELAVAQVHVDREEGVDEEVERHAAQHAVEVRAEDERDAVRHGDGEVEHERGRERVPAAAREALGVEDLGDAARRPHRAERVGAHDPAQLGAAALVAHGGEVALGRGVALLVALLELAEDLDHALEVELVLAQLLVELGLAQAEHLGEAARADRRVALLLEEERRLAEVAARAERRKHDAPVGAADLDRALAQEVHLAAHVAALHDHVAERVERGAQAERERAHDLLRAEVEERAVAQRGELMRVLRDGHLEQRRQRAVARKLVAHAAAARPEEAHEVVDAVAQLLRHVVAVQVCLERVVALDEVGGLGLEVRDRARDRADDDRVDAHAEEDREEDVQRLAAVDGHDVADDDDDERRQRPVERAEVLRADVAVDPRVGRQVSLRQLQLDPRAAEEALGACRDEAAAARRLELALAARGARALADVRAVPERGRSREQT